MEIVSDNDLYKLKVQASILKDVFEVYPSSTIANALSQIEARIKEIESQNKE